MYICMYIYFKLVLSVRFYPCFQAQNQKPTGLCQLGSVLLVWVGFGCLLDFNRTLSPLVHNMLRVIYNVLGKCYVTYFQGLNMGVMSRSVRQNKILLGKGATFCRSLASFNL